jgi:hypothetical protein
MTIHTRKKNEHGTVDLSTLLRARNESDLPSHPLPAISHLSFAIRHLP